jgi:hypothetical protein
LRVPSHRGSVAAISEAIINANFVTSGPVGMKSNAIRQMFCERHLAGASYSDIAKELGISLRTAGYWAAEMGLPRRTGGPRRQRWAPDNPRRQRWTPDKKPKTQ